MPPNKQEDAEEAEVTLENPPISPADDNYYVCVYFKDGKAIGHRGSQTNSFSASISKNSTEKEGNSLSGLELITTEFIETMMGYLEYVPIILQMTPMVSHRMVAKALAKFLDKTCVSSQTESDRIIYKLNGEDYPAFIRFNENLSAAASTSRTLPRLLTVGLVTSLEHSVGLLMKEIATIAPANLFNKEKQVSLNWAMNFNSMEDFKEALINDEIDRAQRESFDQQVSWIIGKVTGMEDFRSKYTGWKDIIELFERRNLFVHANGLVNKSYLNALKGHKTREVSDPKIGDELHAGPKYYTNSVHIVLHFGIMLLQVAWRKLAPSEKHAADKLLSDLGFELIARGQYTVAIRILEFARSLRDVSAEATMRMNVINLANAYKLLSNDKQSETVIESMDWTAVGNEFKISVAAIKGNVEEVVTLMKKIGSDDPIVGAAEYQQWPVFYSVRDDLIFTDTFKLLFRRDFIPSEKRQAGLAQVMKWADENNVSEDQDDDEITPRLQPRMIG